MAEQHEAIKHGWDVSASRLAASKAAFLTADMMRPLNLKLKGLEYNSLWAFVVPSIALDNRSLSARTMAPEPAAQSSRTENHVCNRARMIYSPLGAPRRVNW